MSWIQIVHRDGVEHRLDVVRSQGDHTPKVTVGADGVALANGMSGYVRRFDDVEKAKAWATPTSSRAHPILIFSPISKRWEMGYRETPDANSVAGETGQWVRTDGSWICAVGDELSLALLPPNPQPKGSPKKLPKATFEVQK